MDRKKHELNLDKLLNDVVSKVTSHFCTDEIILFGSYAKGTANELSDVDIAVVSPDLEKNKPLFENALKIKKTIKLYEPYLQMVAFNSDNFYSENFIDPSFVREIKKTGITLYNRHV